ncbi:MAG: nucleotide exchange factor GrpE [Clostridia bacterium]|nr:nucleotide exchange factor GrpE [Clostridia bacterium]MBR2177338.1 nucleotide exchange factor GrpE [Clostridia bacterium]
MEDIETAAVDVAAVNQSYSDELNEKKPIVSTPEAEQTEESELTAETGEENESVRAADEETQGQSENESAEDEGSKAAETEEEAEEPADIEKVYAELKTLREYTSKLVEALNGILSESRSKDAAISDLTAKLNGYKAAMEDQLTNVFFRDVISIIDNIKQMSEIYKSRADNPGFVPCDTFESYAMDLESILLNYHFEIINSNIGDKFNPKVQRAIKKVPTSDKALHSTVETIYSSGYVLSGRVISPEKVAVYFYTEPQGE